MKYLNNLKLLVCIASIFLFGKVKSQIGINTDTIDASAVLQISADGRGLLIPSFRDTGTISKPADGLVFYNNDKKAYYIHTSGSWKIMVPFEIPNDSSIVTKYNVSIKGDILVRNNVTSNGNLTVKGNITTNGDVVANNNVTVNRDVSIGGNVSAQSYSNNLKGNRPVPKGGIIMWSGAIVGNFDSTGLGLVNGLLKGWALCNGKNSTPDLSGRFIVGIGKNIKPASRETLNPNYQINDTGGINRYAFDTLEMPAHKHYATGRTSTDGNHVHYINSCNGLGNYAISAGKDYNQPNGNNVTTTSGGNHSHTISLTTNNSGGSKPHENRPPYYALAFIMKL